MKNTQYLNDRIAAVIPLHISKRYSTKNLIEDIDYANDFLCEIDGKILEVNRIRRRKKGGKRIGLSSRYRYNYRVVLKNSSGKEFVVLLSIFPRCKLHRFLRLEFNPTKARRSGCELLNLLLGYWLQLEDEASIADVAYLKRIDLCRDAYGSLGTFYPYYPKPTVSRIILNKNSGKLETFIIGADESSNRRIVYDKQAESLSKGIVKEGVIRVEQQFTHLNVPFLKVDFETFSSSVGKIRFYSSDCLADAEFIPEFRDDVMSKGINYALGRCGATLKRKYKRRLDRFYICDPFKCNDKVVGLQRLEDVLNIFKRKKR